MPTPHTLSLVRSAHIPRSARKNRRTVSSLVGGLATFFRSAWAWLTDAVSEDVTYRAGDHLCLSCLEVYDEIDYHACSQRIWGICGSDECLGLTQPLDHRGNCKDCGSTLITNRTAIDPLAFGTRALRRVSR